MTETILVTSTAEGTGKTAITIGLGLLAQDAGRDVGYMKPKGTRLRTQVGKVLDADPVLAQELLGVTDAIESMEPVVYSATFLQQVLRGRQEAEEIRAAFEEAYESVAEDRDLVLIEGADRVSTGSVIDLTDVDVASLVDGNAIVVAPYDRVEAVDEVLEVAERFGDRLAGVLFNAVSRDAHDELEADVVPFLEGRGVPVLGAIPRKPHLASVSVEELANEIGGTLITDTPTDGRVERFSVGAMSSDAALRHFRRARDAVVITGGDRSGIQTAALEAPGIKGLVLTGGYHPPGSIVGRAEEAGVPVMTVEADTANTIERVETVLGEGRTRNAAEVEMMRELLADHVDTTALLGTD